MAKKLYSGGRWKKTASKGRRGGRSSYGSTASSWWGSDDDEDLRSSRTRWLDDWDNNSVIGSSEAKPPRRMLTRNVLDAGRLAAREVYAADYARQRGERIVNLDSHCHRAAGCLHTYDRTLRDWATERGKGMGLRGQDLEQYAHGIAAAAALDRLGFDDWLAYAQHYLPPGENGLNSTNPNTPGSHAWQREKDAFAGTDPRMHHYDRNPNRPQRMEDDAAPAYLGGRRAGRETTQYKAVMQPWRPEDADDLAAALMDARREMLVPDSSGSDLGQDAPLWAAGLPVTPFAEREQRLAAGCDVVILVDASGSTMGDYTASGRMLADDLTIMAHSFARALRSAGHGAAVIPWANMTGLPADQRERALGWTDGLTDSVPVWGHGGTDLADASFASRTAFADRPRRRRIALILTDGAVNGERSDGLLWNFAADLTVLWTFGGEAVDDWRGPQLVTRDFSRTMQDLRESDMVRHLAGL